LEGGCELMVRVERSSPSEGLCLSHKNF